MAIKDSAYNLYHTFQNLVPRTVFKIDISLEQSNDPLFGIDQEIKKLEALLHVPMEETIYFYLIEAIRDAKALHTKLKSTQYSDEILNKVLASQCNIADAKARHESSQLNTLLHRPSSARHSMPSFLLHKLEVLTLTNLLIP